MLSAQIQIGTSMRFSQLSPHSLPVTPPRDRPLLHLFLHAQLTHTGVTLSVFHLLSLSSPALHPHPTTE